MASQSKQNFTFIKNRQPLKDQPIENNFPVWQDLQAGYEPPTEPKRSKVSYERLKSRGLL